jgi:hypothetical protein
MQRPSTCAAGGSNGVFATDAETRSPIAAQTIASSRRAEVSAVDDPEADVHRREKWRRMLVSDRQCDIFNLNGLSRPQTRQPEVWKARGSDSYVRGILSICGPQRKRRWR